MRSHVAAEMGTPISSCRTIKASVPVPQGATEAERTQNLMPDAVDNLAPDTVVWLNGVIAEAVREATAAADGSGDMTATAPETVATGQTAEAVNPKFIYPRPVLCKAVPKPLRRPPPKAAPTACAGTVVGNGRQQMMVTGAAGGAAATTFDDGDGRRAAGSGGKAAAEVPKAPAVVAWRQDAIRSAVADEGVWTFPPLPPMAPGSATASSPQRGRREGHRAHRRGRSSDVSQRRGAGRRRCRSHRRRRARSNSRSRSNRRSLVSALLEVISRNGHRRRRRN